MSLTLFNGSYLGHRPTGIGVVARDLVAALSPGQVRLLDPLGGDRPGSIPIPSTMAPEQGQRGHWRRLLWLQSDLPQLMRCYGADLLLSPLPEAPLLRGVRSVVLAHDLLPLRHPQPTPLLAYHLSYVPLVLHQAERVLCNSEATAREVHQRLRVPLRKLVPIRLGFNPRDLHPMDLAREPFFLVLGRHDPHKNLSRVLRALAALPDRSLQLRLVGPPDRRYTPKLLRLATELGIAERCHWHSWVSDAERLELLNRCQALVIASLWEGFGLPALEAMACGTSVIASRSGALPEVVGNMGQLVNPRSVAEISAAMAAVAVDGAMAAAARREGPARAATFNWVDTAREVEQLLAELA
jgi:glycosyltransferase involved in cell wall biosynthesis